MLTIFLSAAVLAGALLTIQAEYRRNRSRVYILKPLTTLLILAVAALSPEVSHPLYRKAILVGLFFALAGDVFLMLPSDKFIAGLICFLITQICYAVAFAQEKPLFSSRWAWIPFVLYGGVFLWYLYPNLKQMAVPVFGYGIAIAAMGWQALDRWMTFENGSAALAVTGAILFLMSDSALAIDRFIGKYRYAPVFILGTYYLAQWLIALSV
ncbi:MAG: lysoplasmalogenase [Calditrichaeota bacterium]|nr:MAG: lysoplasmalogenase [Calditrichota bacterium]